MNRKTKQTLVSSTPQIKKTVRLDSVFENEVISPIVLNVEENRGAAKRPKINVNKPVEEVTTKRKECLPVKVKDTARRAALRDRGVNIKASSSNALSISKQNSNSCYPPLIILDSDEETDAHLTTGKLLLEKKSILKQPSVTFTRVKDVDRRKRTHKNVEESKSIKESKANTKEKPTTSNDQTPQPSCSRRRIAKKHPLSSLANGKQAVVKNSKTPIVANVDTGDSIFCDSILPVNITNVKNKKYLELSSLEDIVGKDVIKWTPRSKGVKSRVLNKKVSQTEAENSDSDDCGGSNTLNINELSRNSIVKEKDKENIGKKITVEQENNISKELFSRFADVVFKPSKKHKGCVIASCLATSMLDIGYLEVDGNASISGKLPNVTYVLLEGSVKALLQGKSQNLANGDILHINNDSGYEFQNLQSTHARFLYVKQKQST